MLGLRINITMDACQQCGKCCTDQVVMLTFDDLHEILALFPQTIWSQIVTFYTVNNEYKDLACLHHYYNSFQLLDSPNSLKEFYLGLKFWPIPHGKSTCVFYNAYTHQCRIHTHKPLNCRIYPYTLHSNSFSLQFAGRCALPVSPLNFIDTKSRIEQIQAYTLSREIYKKQLANWEKNYLDDDKTLQNFMEFAFTYIQNTNSLLNPIPIPNLQMPIFSRVDSQNELNSETIKGILQAHMDDFIKRGVINKNNS